MATIVRGPISARIRFAEGINAEITLDAEMLEHFVPLTDEPYVCDIACSDTIETMRVVGTFTFYPFEIYDEGE